MLIRICLISVIVGALGIVGFDVVLINRKITTAIAERDLFRSERDREASAKRVEQKLAEEARVTLQKTTKELGAAAAERDRAVIIASEELKKSTDLAASLAGTRMQLDKASDRLAAWDQLGFSIEKIRQMTDARNALKAELAAVISENEILYAKTIRLDPRPEIDTWPLEPTLPEGLTGTVLACDPKFQFVVLDFGESQGALEGGQLLVHRKGNLIARVKITDNLQSNRCVANVMPGWKLGEITEGDQVITR